MNKQKEDKQPYRKHGKRYEQKFQRNDTFKWSMNVKTYQ